jgi:hypothetical protein
MTRLGAGRLAHAPVVTFAAPPRRQVARGRSVRLFHVPLDRLYVLIAEPKMMRDFVHKDAAHQPVEILLALNPFQQDRLPV